MKHSRAFTLLEMIVAIGIFAVIAVVSYASLSRFLDNSGVLQAEMNKLKELQLVFSLLEQDMHYLTDRSVRDGYGDPEPVLMINNGDVAGELLRFTTARPNPFLPESSTLQRTSYRLENGDLIRANWRVLDRDQDSSEQKHLLLSDVGAVTVNVLQSYGDALQSLSSWDKAAGFPAGVEWNIQLADGKNYRRVFEVKGQLNKP